MPLTVRAQIVDIRADTPNEADRFLVDTNAWYWLFYSRASQTPSAPSPQQLGHYPAYIRNAIQAKAALHCCALNYSELAHNIEKAEREIYAKQAGKVIGAKEFRHDYPNQRRKIAALINETWEDVCSVSTMLDSTLDSGFLSAATSLFPLVGLDGYDLFMVESARRQGVIRIITDDSDYATVPGLFVFTANQKVIQAAQAIGKLLRR
jgi:hypothetical protein